MFCFNSLFFSEKSTWNWEAIFLVANQSTQELVLDPAGGVMSNLITQDPIWLPTVCYLKLLLSQTENYGPLEFEIMRVNCILPAILFLNFNCLKQQFSPKSKMKESPPETQMWKGWSIFSVKYSILFGINHLLKRSVVFSIYTLGIHHSDTLIPYPTFWVDCLQLSHGIQTHCTVCLYYRKLRVKKNSLESPFRTIFPA